MNLLIILHYLYFDVQPRIIQGFLHPWVLAYFILPLILKGPLFTVPFYRASQTSFACIDAQSPDVVNNMEIQGHVT